MDMIALNRKYFANLSEAHAMTMTQRIKGMILDDTRIKNPAGRPGCITRPANNFRDQE